MRWNYTRDELLNTAKASPAAVAVHDREAWLSLFASYNIVEDPVGSKPHVSGIFDCKTGKRGRGPLERFYDTFIAPNAITFHVNQDLVVGNKVIRDLTIETKMPTGLAMHVPMHVIYEMVSEGGEPKVARLGAYWELPTMVTQILGKGALGIFSMVKLGLRMMKYQGVSGALGFSKGFLGIHQRGKELAREFIDAVNRKDAQRLLNLFSPRNTGIEFPANRACFSPDAFLKGVDTCITISNLISAGFITSFAFELTCQGANHQGVGMVEFNSRTKKIEAARFFWEDEINGF